MGTEFSYEYFNRVVRQPAFARDDTYLNSPLYYVLTGRKGVWVHEGFGAVMVVCAHPHVADRLLVFPEIGNAGGRLAASVLGDMDVPAGGVQLARFNDADLKTLRDALGQQNFSRVDSIDPMAEPVLDWAYPVHILDTGRVAMLDGPDFTKIRNKIRKVEGDITTIPLDDPTAMRAMRAAHKYWEGSMVFRNLGQEDDLSEFYLTLFNLIKQNPGLFRGHVYMQKNRPVGFTVLDQPFNATSNLLASLGDASITGLADYQIVTTCRSLAGDGVRFMNFGGSESQSLDLFKRKFMPVQSIIAQSAEIVYAPRQNMHVRSGMLQMNMECRVS